PRKDLATRNLIYTYETWGRPGPAGSPWVPSAQLHPDGPPWEPPGYSLESANRRGRLISHRHINSPVRPTWPPATPLDESRRGGYISIRRERVLIRRQGRTPLR